MTEVIDEHARIYDRVTSGDAAGAQAAMREHLAQTERSLYAALDLPLNGSESTT